MKNRKKSAFTLIEVLVVVAILLVLAALAFPMLNSAQYKAKIMQSVSSLRQIGLSTATYAQDHNGEINGLGNQPFPEFVNDTKPVGHPWRVAASLGVEGTGKNGKLRWEDVDQFLRAFHHPHIPAELAWGPEGYRWTVAVNDRFSLGHARNEGSFARMSAFQEPSNTIYACCGIWALRPEMADDDAFLVMPTDAPRNGPYFTKQRQLPVVFLDGSGGLESFPLSRSRIDPDLADE